jgi:hypothetical protein
VAVVKPQFTISQLDGLYTVGCNVTSLVNIYCDGGSAMLDAVLINGSNVTYMLNVTINNTNFMAPE